MKAFRNPTQKELEIAKKNAYRFVYNAMNIALNKRFNYDARTRIGFFTSQLVDEILKTFDVSAYKQLKRKRSENKPKPFENVLTNPLVRDWKNNRPCFIYKDHLHFGSRNHWAKNDFDLKILNVLSNKK